MDPQHEIAEIQAAQGDSRRFTPLYQRYFSDIFRFILRRATDHELTADLTQQTFLKAMLALPKYEARGTPFRAWLYRIALNELRMHWRKRKEVVVNISFLEAKGLSDVVGLPSEDERMQPLALALGRLNAEKARLIELRFMDGLSFAEMGDVLGIGEDAAKMRTHRVLTTLRTYLVQRA
ncbi:MAG: sigma-70 family RNA polymerase sigma factor [Flavobacteriales bacterium]|nr:sigma-70 family RNA polymerase sigma factor [Flavobacteriales bacterium]MBK6946022.1 sigma-70 family RNA polymerase sigma factor [Flavobacteriales bacterium]MBK7239040.1 sigma-70 family RNA polymerase sigma factor [Flavobacteriales bacterium]MBK9536855.1 sigma-70 family RNA polymerase sigma factor [Flavobacteriales bacterium]MBP9138121.1 sigma-70 family RNA polymerase sigma factor [Flavobacteriales bacterium]